MLKTRQTLFFFVVVNPINQTCWIFFYHVPCGRLETRKTDHICQVQTLLPTIKWRGCVAGAEENKKKKWSKVTGEIFKKKHFSGLCAIMNGRYTLTTWFTSSPCYSILLALSPPPPKERDLGTKCSFFIWSHILDECSAGVSTKLREFVAFWRSSWKISYLMFEFLLTNFAWWATVIIILCDEPLVNCVLELR
jgi:hypothetical protein